MTTSGTAPTPACASARERIVATKRMQQETKHAIIHRCGCSCVSQVKVNCNAYESNLIFAQLTESVSYATCIPFLHCTDFPSVAVVRCKMRGLFMVVVLMAMLVSQITIQGQSRLTCKLSDHITRSIYL